MTISNFDFERQVLGGLIKDPQHQNSREALDSLSGIDFYDHKHSMIFNTIKKMSESSSKIDLVTVEDELNKSNIEYGGFIYIAELMKDNVSIYNMSSYVDGIKKSSSIRMLLQCSENIKQLVNENLSPFEIIDQIEQDTKQISSKTSGRDLKHICDATSSWLDLMQRRENAVDGIVGISTGISDLDHKLGGIDEESLIVVAGRPSMGKTLFCQCLCQNVGIHQGKNVLFFSMEMSQNQLFERFVSGISGVSNTDLRLARLDTETNKKIDSSVGILNNSGIHYCCEQSQSVGQIRAKVRRHKNKHPGLSMIMIDYLGLMSLPKADRHDISIGLVTRALKELAKEVKVPVILIAQANRELDKARRPTMSNIKDSSAIEADADVVMFVHRQEVADPETCLTGLTELIIAKDRHNDGNGTVYLEKVNGTFAPLSYREAAEMEVKEELRLNPPKELQERGFKGNARYSS